MTAMPQDAPFQVSKDTEIEATVIVTAYRPRPFLIEALKSAVNQDAPRERFEVILATNFKDDLVEAYCREHDIRVLLSDDQTQGGKVCAALEVAKGGVICFLEDDDIFKPQKVSQVLQTFHDRPGIQLYHNSVDVIGGKVELPDRWKRVSRNIEALESLGEVSLSAKDYRVKNPIRKMVSLAYNASAISVRRSILGTAQLSILRRVKTGLDTFLFLFALQAGELYTDRRRLSCLRVHEDSTDAYFSQYTRQDLEQLSLTLKEMTVMTGLMAEAAKLTGISELGDDRFAAHYFYKVRSEVIQCRSRSDLASELMAYLSNSTLRTFLYRFSTAFYLTGGIISPSMMKRLYLGRLRWRMEADMADSRRRKAFIS